MNWYIVEQLPVIANDAYDRRFGAVTARELVHDHVLRLTYTAHDMAPFARDLGYGGPPFVWDDEERRHLRARLDALYFHLYGLDRDDAGYVLNTFPIVRREDQAQFNRYRTKELILAYMNALAPETPTPEWRCRRPCVLSKIRSNRTTIEAITRLIVERFEPEQIILFGSCARDETDENSDLDLLVVLPHGADIPGRGNPSATPSPTISCCPSTS